MTTQIVFDLKEIVLENNPDLSEEKAQQIAEFIVPRVDRTYFIDEVHRWIDMYLSSEQPQQ
jgi:hypothetical protein